MKICFRPICLPLLLAILLSTASAAVAGEWLQRLYGYRPQNYGYPPSNYIFPRYGLVRGTVYYQGPPYGAPPPEAFGPPMPPAPLAEDGEVGMSDAECGVEAESAPANVHVAPERR